jgi:hypothetical protein
MDDHYHHHYSSYHHPSRMTTSHPPSSYYNHQQYHYSDRPIMRSDREEERYFQNGHQWQHQTYAGSCVYPTSATPLSYSEESNGKIGST